jgi:hypothetical protein
MKNMNAHMNGSGISSLCFSYDNTVLASRGGLSISLDLCSSLCLGFMIIMPRSDVVKLTNKAVI